MLKSTPTPEIAISSSAISETPLLKPKSVIIQLTPVEPMFAPNMIPMALLSVKMFAPTNASTISETSVLLCKMAVTIAPVKIARTSEFVLDLSHDLKCEPATLLIPLSMEIIPKRNSPSPAKAPTRSNTNHHRNILMMKVYHINTILLQLCKKGSTMSNELAKEDSPYLNQHKDDLVQWVAWSDEALTRAKDEHKAIFISIGYSSCHWCHVMQKEVFNHPECAKILNESFINIKIDKEERPDLDKYYQSVYHLLNRRGGGWPTSIFATPENKPIFAGTYIPPLSGVMGAESMGFLELTTLIAQKIAQNDEQVFKNADEIQGYINHKDAPKEATKLIEDIYKNFLHQARQNYDTKNGGFSVAPKFPHANTLKTLLLIDKLYDDKSARSMVIDTLKHMKKGGMYDLVEGGFCRYSVDELYLVPHFEKMLYDNALLCELYTLAYLEYGDESFLDIAKEIAIFWHTKMSKDLLMFSASDADSKAGEGDYYTYTYDEVLKALKDADALEIKRSLSMMGVTEHGNFEGKNIIRLEHEFCEFEHIKPLLQSLREDREYPFVDRKVQTSWSAMMIRSMFLLGEIDLSFRDLAKSYLDRLLEVMFNGSVLYHTTLHGKTPKVEAFLEDYAFLSSALISAFDSTQDEIYLIKAQQLANMALAKFYKKGLWKFGENEDGFDVDAEADDNTYTSSLSTMIEVLLSLATLLEDGKYRHFAFKSLEYHSYDLSRRSIVYPSMIASMLRHLKGDLVVKNREITKHNIRTAKYPFLHKKLSDDEGFLVCGESSCYGVAKSVDEIDLIERAR